MSSFAAPSKAFCAGDDRTLHYYPLGVEQADFAVLPFTTGSDGQLQLTGAVSYLGPEVAEELNSCLQDRLAAEGYDLTAPVGTSGGTVGPAAPLDPVRSTSMGVVQQGVQQGEPHPTPAAPGSPTQAAS